MADADMLANVERVSKVTIMPSMPGKSVEEPSIYAPDENTRRAIRTMRKAFADAVLENLRFGLPVIQWRDGKVVEVPAEQLAPLARRILATNPDAVGAAGRSKRQGVSVHRHQRPEVTMHV